MQVNFVWFGNKINTIVTLDGKVATAVFYSANLISDLYQNEVQFLDKVMLCQCVEVRKRIHQELKYVLMHNDLNGCDTSK